jgi:hypothetical protein
MYVHESTHCWVARWGVRAWEQVISTLPFKQFWPTHWGRIMGQQGSVQPASISQVPSLLALPCVSVCSALTARDGCRRWASTSAFRPKTVATTKSSTIRRAWTATLEQSARISTRSGSVFSGCSRTRTPTPPAADVTDDGLSVVLAWTGLPEMVCRGHVCALCMYV